MADSIRDTMLEAYIYESAQLLEQLEQNLISAESNNFNISQINEIFRVMHTLKGSSAMMEYQTISSLAHAAEDLFYFLREEKPKVVDYSSVTDVTLEASDFIKQQIARIEVGGQPDGDPSKVADKIHSLLSKLKDLNSKGTEEEASNNTVSEVQQQEPLSGFKSYFVARVYFTEDCQMENLRAFGVVNSLEKAAGGIKYFPGDIMENEASAEVIKKNGFCIYFGTDSPDEYIHKLFMDTIFLKDLSLQKLSGYDEYYSLAFAKTSENKQLEAEPDSVGKSVRQSIISVKVEKLDQLMNAVGELVVAQSMVLQNPDLNGLSLDNFNKAAHQLTKITDEIKEIAMSVRMVSLAPTFNKMSRIVRDMSKKLSKQVTFKIIGEETEVDKNIIEHLSDPLMHIIRNSLDHGLETAEERQRKGKPPEGLLTLEARADSGFVFITVKDDGKGLNKEKIYSKAKTNGLTKKDISQLSDKEIYSFIFAPGFSTNEKVTEYSGRGVGMDVVKKNMEQVGAVVSVDSEPDKWTVTTLKIPLTIAILEGMLLSVGDTVLTVPTKSIKEAFIAKKDDIFAGPDNTEMIMVRQKCYSVLRLKQFYGLKTGVDDIEKGIMIILENGDNTACIFADALLGEQQIVIKPIPKLFKYLKGLSGCALLGSGDICLIADVSALVNLKSE